MAATHLDPRVALPQSDITEVNGKKLQSIGFESVSRCIFSSIPEFLDYFKTRNILPIYANQPFEIHDLSFLFHLHQIDPEHLPKKPFDKCLFIVNKILALVAKQGYFIGWKEGTVEMSSRLLSLTFHSDIVLRVENGPITIRPRHLFGMMKAYSVSSIAFSPKQPLQFVGVTHTELNITKPPYTNLKKWSIYAPTDCEVTWIIKKGAISYLSGPLYGLHRPKAFQIQAPYGMILSLSQRLSVIAPDPLQSLIRFSEEMQLKEDFVFNNPNAVVIIERNIIGIDKKVSILAKNVIVFPNARLQVSELDVTTEGSSLLLNITANKVNLITHGYVVLGNSRIGNCLGSFRHEPLVFGLKTTIDIGRHYDAISRVLHDAIPAHLYRFIPANQLLLT